LRAPRASSRSSRASSPSPGRLARTADGLLLVDKPAGVSSHDVVAVARRALGEKRVGHAGTLDPFATGLLVLLAGRATRLMRYLHDEPKVYEAVVQFGTETDTEDLHGAVVRDAPLPSREALDAAALGLVGETLQVPPAYSAKRIEGKRAYQLAREGVALAMTPVRVTVHSLALDGFEGTPDAVERCRLRASCGGGTYVRSLARDLARAATSAGHCVALRRLEAGVFSAARALTLEALQASNVALESPLRALAGYPRQDLTTDEFRQVIRGIDVEARVEGAFAALVDADVYGGEGTLIAFAERRPSEKGDRWQPRVVMRDARDDPSSTRQ
jgi:tRNA pseudouridine55 synthase